MDKTVLDFLQDSGFISTSNIPVQQLLQPLESTLDSVIAKTGSSEQEGITPFEYNSVDKISIDFFKNNAMVDLATVNTSGREPKNTEYEKEDPKQKQSFSDVHLEGLEQESPEYPIHVGVRSVKSGGEIDKGVHRGVIHDIHSEWLEESGSLSEDVETMEDIFVSDIPAIKLSEPVEIEGEIFDEGTIIRIIKKV